MKIPRKGLKGYERQTSNVQHRMLNKVFCQFLNRRSEGFHHWMFNARCSKNALLCRLFAFICLPRICTEISQVLKNKIQCLSVKLRGKSKIIVSTVEEFLRLLPG